MSTIRNIWPGNTLHQAVQGLLAFMLLLCLIGVMYGALLTTFGAFRDGPPRRGAVSIRLVLYSIAGATVAGVVARNGLPVNFSLIPAQDFLQQVINGVGATMLLSALFGLVVGGLQWAVGRVVRKPDVARSGKRMTVSSCGLAAVLGVAAAIVNEAFNLGVSN